MTIDIMLDLETMDTGPHAAIVAIGAVAVDAMGGRILTPMWYCSVDLKSAIELGGTVSGDTIMWWMKQSDAARNKLAEDPKDIDICLTAFSTWVKSWGDVRMWGNGSDFDNVILGNAFKRSNIPLPWTYKNNRCFRTVINLAKGMNIPKPERVGVHHNALDDALYQAYGLVEFAKRVEIR